jgi:hypothetical protein
VRGWIAAGLLAAVVVVSAAAAALPPPRTTKAPWPRPADPLALARRAGLKPEPHEFFGYHVHAHLDVFLNGRKTVPPAGIGINISDPAVKRFPEPDGSTGYGGISPPCKHPCISPLHTHDPDGVLHTESARARPNRLGEFFTEWNVRLTRKCIGGYCGNVRFYVGGKPYRGDPRAITLTNLKDIVITVGQPPKSIPSRFPQ